MTKTKISIVAIAILLVVITGFVFIESIRSFESRTPFGLWKKSIFIYDRKFIPILTNISAQIPQDDAVVISSLTPYAQPKFFINHQLIFPSGDAVSKKSLVNWMSKNNLSYLLVLENFSRRDQLKGLFSKDGLYDLHSDFKEIGVYFTDTQLRYHLYVLQKRLI